MLNLNIPLRKRLANRKADKAYLNQIEPMGHGFNGDGAGRVPVVYSHGSLPFRDCGYADEIIRLRHNGYFTDSEFQDDTMRGVVYQIPARHGKTQFLAGYEMSCNDEIVLYLDVHDDKEDAARVADSHAECSAEREREYQDNARREMRAEDIRAELATLKDDRRNLRAELRTLCKSHKLARRTVRAAIADSLATSEKLAKELGELE